MVLTALLAVFGAAAGWCADSTNNSSSGSSDPLLDLFIKKGYVTQEEAEKVKAEADFNRTNGAAYPQPATSKWKISNGIQSVELFGDVRLRYEGRKAQDPNGGYINLERLRYSLRLGLRGDAYNDFYYGFRLETSQNPRSSWVTMGSAAPTSSSSPYSQSPYGKSTAGINVGQIYLGWKPEDWVNITLGKMSNPLYTTPMVWSGSLNPEGAAEQFKYTVGEADFFATFGQFVYQDATPNQSSSGYFNLFNNDSSQGGLPFLLAWEGGVNYHLTKNVSFKVASVLYQYTRFNNGQTPPPNSSVTYTPDFSGTFVGQGQTNGVGNVPASYNLGSSSANFDGFFANQTGINDLLVLEFPFELNVKLEKLNLRFFGDYAYNLDGVDRANAAYNVSHSAYFAGGLTGPSGGGIDPISSPQTHDVHAYQIGFGVGSSNVVYGPMQGLVYGNSSRANAWEFRTYWQHVEQYSLDPNLIDTDFFEGVENLQGIYTAFAYAFGDNVIGTIRYGHASRINAQLGTGGSGQDIPQMNPISTYNLLQVDLSVRF